MTRSIETRTIGRVTVHTVKVGDNDPDPYVVAADAPSIHDGDVVVVGRTIGVRILSGHTCAVTEETGGFATLDPDSGTWATMLGGRYAGAYNAASHVAGELFVPLMGARSTPTAKGRATAKRATTTAAKSTAATRAAAGFADATRDAVNGRRTRASALAAKSHHLGAFSPAAMEPASASSSATTRRTATPRRTVPGVQFSDGR